MRSFIEETIEFMEIGASGGLRDFGWLSRHISYLGFEPNERLAKAKLKYLQEKRNFKNIEIFPYALSPFDDAELYLTEHVGCSSLLEPNLPVLKEFKGPRKNAKSTPWCDQFKVLHRESVSSANPEGLDFLKAKKIDAIQIDIQGLEYEVLSLLPNLENVLFIEVEVSIRQLYVDQKLFDQIHNLMEQNDMQLVAIDNRCFASRYNLSKNEVNRIPECRGDIIQFDAIYIKKSSVLKNKGDHVSLMKIGCLMETVGNFPLAAFYAQESSDLNSNKLTKEYIDYLEEKATNRTRHIKWLRPFVRIFNLVLRIIGSSYRADLIMSRDEAR